MCKAAAMGTGAGWYHVGGIAAGASPNCEVLTSAAEAVRTVAGFASVQHSLHPISTGELQACAKAMLEANSHSSSTSAASRGSCLRMPAMTFSIEAMIGSPCLWRLIQVNRGTPR